MAKEGPWIRRRKRQKIFQVHHEFRLVGIARVRVELGRTAQSLCGLCCCMLAARSRVDYGGLASVICFERTQVESACRCGRHCGLGALWLVAGIRMRRVTPPRPLALFPALSMVCGSIPSIFFDVPATSSDPPSIFGVATYSCLLANCPAITFLWRTVDTIEQSALLCTTWPNPLFVAPF